MCAVDAAIRAVQLKVAIPSQWLRFHQKEGLYQEEEITARTSGRSHLIKEQEAKNYNFLCGGGQQDGYPSWRNFSPKIGGSATFPLVTDLRLSPTTCK
jgi:hypothetical protein